MKTKQIKKCMVCGGEHYAKGLCKSHYQRQRKGIPLDYPPLKKTNDYEIKNDIAEVYYEDINRNRAGSFVIDKEDLEKIKAHKWSIISTGYIVAYKGNRTLMLHRVITDCPDGMEVDHINHDKTDNRKSNLRVCTRRQNSFNKKAISNTGEYGISFSKGYYHIQVDKKYCGITKDFQEAVRIRNENLKGTEKEKYNYKGD